jgi:hypothetical protein
MNDFAYLPNKHILNMSHENHSSAPKKGFWYTYFGIGGAAVFAFLWIIVTLWWIIYVLMCG